MAENFFYKCSQCGKEYGYGEVSYLCPVCSAGYKPGVPLLGVLEVIYDYSSLKKYFRKHKTDWNDFLPVDKKYLPNYFVGGTPFHKTINLGNHFGFTNVWIKNDGLNPSGSLKDRASFLVVAESNRLGIDEIVTASTGNAASSLSTVCAAAGKKAVIFLPVNAPKAKLVQNILCGAEVIPVKGTYDDAFRLSLEYTSTKGGLNRNTAYHPFTIEGKKTVGLEIFSQNNFKTPDSIIVPVGDGVIIAGVYKAFYDLVQIGIADKIPKMICVQAESSSAIHNYIKSGIYKNAENPMTIADSISVKTPSNVFLAGRAVKESGGLSLTVTDDEIMQGQKLLAEKTGVFAEPSASVVVAGLQKLSQENLLKKHEQIVLLITGHGLKDIETPLRNLKIPEAQKL